jgi:phosphate transport system permease protein
MKSVLQKPALESPPRRSLAHGAGLRRRVIVDLIMKMLIGGSALLTTFLLVFILGYIAVQGAPALNLAFFVERPLPFGEPGGGIAPAILGTLVMLSMASLIGIPIGIGAAIYLAEYGRGRFGDGVRFATDLLAGLPSIAVGVFVWAILVKSVIGSYSGLAGAVALAIIMIPIITRTVENILQLVPDSLREASLALGVPRWRTTLRVVLPSATGGIVTGVVLSVARAGGETAPLLLTALGSQFFSLDVLNPMASMPVQIYNYAVSPYEDWHAKAWGSALVLVVIIGGLSVLTRLTTRRRGL